MINYSLNPTDENVIQVFGTDAIKRKEAVLRFVSLIEAINDCCSIALNGEWGSGKTFFVKQVKMLLDYTNSYSDMTDETRKAIGTVLPKDFHSNTSCATVYYDAWANDSDEDPIISIIHETIRSNQTDFKPDQIKNLCHITTSIVGALAGKDILSAVKEIQGIDPLQAMRNKENISTLVSEFIDELIYEEGGRVVIFIDELDRCKPVYAIRLLERIKHYFNDDRITFVFSVSISQLIHTVRCYYGVGFDATRYLDKFFDLRLSVPAVDYDIFVKSKFDFIENYYVYDDVCIKIIKYFHLSLRETERYMRLMRIAAREKIFNSSNSNDTTKRAKAFAYIFVLPIAIGLSMTDIDGYTAFIKGTDPNHMIDALIDYEYILDEYIFENNEILYSSEATRLKDMLILREERIRESYYAIFTEKYNVDNSSRTIGPMRFTADIRNKIIETASLMSPISAYNIN